MLRQPVRKVKLLEDPVGLIGLDRVLPNHDSPGGVNEHLHPRSAYPCGFNECWLEPGIFDAELAGDVVKALIAEWQTRGVHPDVIFRPGALCRSGTGKVDAGQLEGRAVGKGARGVGENGSGTSGDI